MSRRALSIAAVAFTAVVLALWGVGLYLTWQEHHATIHNTRRITKIERFLGQRGPRGKPGKPGKTKRVVVRVNGKRVVVRIPIRGKGVAGIEGVQGERGERGERGPRGTPGQRGAMGEQGEHGSRGERGARGAQGTQGPRGATGATGATGPQGATGPSGAPCPAGYTGTFVKVTITSLGIRDAWLCIK